MDDVFGHDVDEEMQRTARPLSLALKLRWARVIPARHGYQGRYRVLTRFDEHGWADTSG